MTASETSSETSSDTSSETTSGIAAPLRVRSDLLGELSVPPQQLVSFPHGLFGFPECREFALVPAERHSLFWLQSTAHPTLAFLLADPFEFFAGYAADVSPTDLAELQAKDAADVALLAIVTLPGARTAKPTANLQGPVAINLEARVGRQLAIEQSEFGVRCEFEIS